ncbi:hypothetical protein BDZ85DRAFT_265749 [Elsinoe ampelina]|uniref:RNase III domain-containing protein n=1 Tax=Elsinoe ampelina TaxID=302913 RepID=A0A6A6G7I7_9PEZI|nr:hypothetical protein BDZ85DRAFT_265749 [Elsinoe ampelina]
MPRLSDPSRAQQILNYSFEDLELLKEALQAPGAGEPIRGRIIPDGNKRLSLVGLSVINFTVTLESYQGGSSKGDISANVQARVSQSTLADLTRQSTLDMCIATNPSQGDNDVAPVLRADTIKAVLAAVWIDCRGAVGIWSPIAASLGIVV